MNEVIERAFAAAFSTVFAYFLNSNPVGPPSHIPLTPTHLLSKACPRDAVSGCCFVSVPVPCSGCCGQLRISAVTFIASGANTPPTWLRPSPPSRAAVRTS
jgi:hypothetical protein